MSDRTLYAAAKCIGTYRQTEGSALTYAIQWAGEHDDVATSAWAVTDGSATISGATLADNRVTVLITANVSGWSTVTNTITTDSGQTDQRQIRIRATDNEQGYRSGYGSPYW